MIQILTFSAMLVAVKGHLITTGRTKTISYIVMALQRRILPFMMMLALMLAMI